MPASNTQPLDKINQIVGPDGRPTVFFLQYMNTLQGDVSAVSESNALLTGHLTRPATSVIADEEGTVSDFSEAGGTFKAYYENDLLTTGVVFSVVSETGVDVSIDSSTGVYTVNSMSADAGTATFRAQYGSDTVDLDYAIVKAYTGAQAITILLTNEHHDIVTDADGTNGDFSEANGNIEVYGYNGDITSLCTYSVLTQNNCTGTVNTADNTPTNGEVKGYYEVTAISAATAYLEIQVTYNGVNYSKKFTLARNKSGASIKLLADRQIMTYDSTDTLNPGGQTIALDVELNALTGSVSWDMREIDGGGSDTSGLLNIAGDGLSATLDGSDFDTARGTSEGVKITISKSDGINTYYDYVTIARVKTGADGSDGTDGADALDLSVYSTRYGFSYDPQGDYADASEYAICLAEQKNSSATINWSIYDLDGNEQTPTSNYLSSTTGSSTQLDVEEFDDAAGSTGGVRIEAEFTDGSTFTDSVTIHKVNDGPPAVGFAQDLYPGTGDFVNQLWHDTNNNLLYRWNGSMWKQVEGDLAEFDLVSEGLIEDGAINVAGYAVQGGNIFTSTSSTASYSFLANELSNVSHAVIAHIVIPYEIETTDPNEGDEFSVDLEIFADNMTSGSSEDAWSATWTLTDVWQAADYTGTVTLGHKVASFEWKFDIGTTTGEELVDGDTYRWGYRFTNPSNCAVNLLYDRYIKAIETGAFE